MARKRRTQAEIARDCRLQYERRKAGLELEDLLPKVIEYVHSLEMRINSSEGKKLSLGTRLERINSILSRQG